MTDAANVHGPDGLGGVCSKYLDPAVQEQIRSEPDAAFHLFKEILSGHGPETVTLVTTGPLTNVAHWIKKAPKTVKMLKEIISMGGVFFQAGNHSQAAEFNVHSDPTSGRKVVEFCRKQASSGIYEGKETIPLTFIGLDVTHQVRFRRERLDQALKERPNEPGLLFIKEITGHYMDFYFRNEGLNGCYLHDPLAVGYLIDPGLYQAERYHMEVENKGKFTSGMTVADYRPTRLFKDKSKEVTWVCYKVQSERFEETFLKRLLG